MPTQCWKGRVYYSKEILLLHSLLGLVIHFLWKVRLPPLYLKPFFLISQTLDQRFHVYPLCSHHRKPPF
ncbi:hypothetical protein XELAEV_18039000mg [Xenopus laevis]|uniref:Uncharacterized protein n=1 Tax=Xenopus laevis TaxID=8355 RepID=A0A974H7H5_XENLA|nr:hypothetical protein XELAEV_18039000mg [Xenopus laevis]